jgi:hypothetical protein
MLHQYIGDVEIIILKKVITFQVVIGPARFGPILLIKGYAGLESPIYWWAFIIV